MPSAGSKQAAKPGKREPDSSGPSPSELRPFAHPVTDALVLAATERAECHQARSEPGVMPREAFEHMGFLYNAAATRQLRLRLDGLMEAGLLEHARRPHAAVRHPADSGQAARTGPDNYSAK